VLVAGQARSSSEALFVVSQPMIESDSGEMIVGSTTYLRWVGWVPPGYAVSLTCEPSAVSAVYEGQGVIDKNAAHEAGIRLKMDPERDGRNVTRTDRGMFLDTLYVTMDLSAAETNVRRDSLRSWQRSEEERVAQFRADTTGVGRFVATYTEGRKTFRYLLGRTIDVTIQCMIENAVRSPIPIRHMNLKVAGSPFFRNRARTYAIPDSFAVRRRR
jgi:hypothetical protein